ncbi:Ras association (RalGDS/AF-6) and pleckstrin domains 1b [Trichostrongylus colubriformis]|uniref:Ras association (RalGDS/AF-6) and pleckstrin domains 1b n=1 Tax=Trichostrongylus colubriformis TaxID=6319 RepID=A0AAN8IIH2_TRICO
MREAKVTRIFVKFFVEDGAPLQMLVDERWTVADTMQQLADKHHIFLCEDHCIVEEFPDLYIRRIYEDHENLVENISMWVQDSPNKLHFIRRPDKYPFIDRPELYLVTEKTADLEVPPGNNWTREVKAQFVQEFFTRETVSPPELEGFLYLKSDGRKSWKKHFFVLRPSGLYYAPKGKKSSKDLQCLMNLHSNQVYTGINWAKKYKAPTDWCIAIKLTQLQMKRSQYIKYICADDEATFRKWLVGLRIAKVSQRVLIFFLLLLIRTPDDEDSDEEFPAPPPVLSRTSTPSQTEARIVPVAPAKPLRQSITSPNSSPMKQQLPPCVSPPQPFSPLSQPGTPTPKKAPPPPPPKRSDATRVVTAISPQPNHMSDLEAALARRREKIAQN